MINWMFFPQYKSIPTHLSKIVSVFKAEEHRIDSTIYNGPDNLKSDEVLAIVSSGLRSIGYQVETSKKSDDKIRVPVLCGLNGHEDLAFEVDAYSKETQTVIEVEAGRAVANYQFLKDLYEACMMQDVRYLCLSVKNLYKTSKDFSQVCKFFETLYISPRMNLPLEGVLIIGY